MPLQFSIDCFEVGEHDTAIWLEQVPAETVQVINSNADDAGGSPILFYKNTSGSSDFSHLRKVNFKKESSQSFNSLGQCTPFCSRYREFHSH